MLELNANASAPADDLIKDSDETTFMEDVVEASKTTPVIVDFWAPWCGPCRNFAPIYEQAAQQLEPKLRFAKLNTEDQQQVAERWNIRSIPTLILFRAGKEVTRVSGAMSLSQLKQWLAQNGVS